MGKSVEFTPDSKGIRALTASDDIGQVCVAAAEAGKTFAESIAPIGPTGNYARGFRVAPVDVTVPGPWGSIRAGAVLYNEAPHAHLVEWRNDSRVLERAAAYIEGTFN